MHTSHSRQKRRKPFRILGMAIFFGCCLLLGHSLLFAEKSQSKSQAKKTAQITPQMDPFSGLPPMKATGKEVHFNFRPGPKPPGKIGTHQTLSFPPKTRTKLTSAPKIKKKPLKVIHTRPKGKVRLISAVSVTFNQPMIPLSSLKQTKLKKPPFKIIPQPKGRFRWLDTSTIGFEPKGRMPYATKYKIVVPKGTKSLDGMQLKQKYSFTFTTPRLKVARFYPRSYKRERPDTWIGIQFNQSFDRKSLLRHLRIKGPRGFVRYTVVPPSKWSKNKRQFGLYRSLNKKRSVVLKPRRKLKKASRYKVFIYKGTKGEGPLRTKKKIAFGFRTYGAMFLKKSYCNRRKSYLLGLLSRCYPRTQLIFRFTNRLGPNNWKKIISYNRKFKDVLVRNYGNYLYLSRPKGWPPSKALIVRFRKGIKDIYGQKTNDSHRMRFKFLDAPAFLKLPRYRSATIEKHMSQRFFIKIRNVFKIRQRLAHIEPHQLYRYTRLTRRMTGRKYRSRDPLAGAKVIQDKTFWTQAKKNERSEWQINLDQMKAKKTNLAMVVLSSPALAKRNKWASQHRAMIILSTDIGLTLRYGFSKIALLAMHLKSGKLLQHAKLQLYSFDGQHKLLWSGQTDKRGYAVIPGPEKLKRRGEFLLLASKGDDQAYVILRNGGSSGYTFGFSRWSRIPAKYANQFFIFTERAPYKPGETIHIRGILRRQVNRPFGGIEAFPKSKKKVFVHYTLRSPRYQQVKKGKIPLQAGGTFSLDYTLKELAGLGNYRLRGYAHINGKRITFYHSILVQAYRAPEYKVAINAQKGPYFLGQKKVRHTIEGRYTFGAPMTKARVSWTLRRSAGDYRPPNQPSGFHFGLKSTYHAGWRDRRRRSSGQLIKSGQGRLNAQGQLVLKLDLKKSEHKGPTNYLLEAQVYDKNRQAIAGRKTILAHPSSIYIGLHSKKPVLKAKEKSHIEVVATSIAGKRLSGVKVKIKVLQRRTTRKAIKRHGAWSFVYKSKEVNVTGCQILTSQEIKKCSIRVPRAGYYIIQARTKDSSGRWSTTRMGVYAYGSHFVQWQTNQPNRLEMVPDKKLYKAGQMAKILIKSPFRYAHGILTIERNGIAEHRPVFLDSSAQAISIKIRREYLPNVWVALSLARGRIPISQLGIKDKKALDLGRPAYAFGQIRLKVSLTEKQIRVQLKPSTSTIRPGGKVSIRIKTTDHQGRPVKGIVTLALVDEGVLSLLGFQTPSPLKKFFTPRPSWTVLKDLRVSLLRRKKKKKIAHNTRKQYRPRALKSKEVSVVRLQSRAVGRTTTAMDDDSSAPNPSKAKVFAASVPPSPVVDSSFGRRSGGKRSGGVTPIRVRSSFATTAFYRSIVRTGANGTATVTVKMPDNLTTFRIMAVAVDEVQPDRFGHGESRVVIRKPLLLRPALPRFANFGDRFEAAVVINNETGKTGTVKVYARGINVQFVGKTRKQIIIPAGEAREVRFKVKVQKTGIARFQFSAILGKETDAVEKSIPILLPATAEAFATYGTTTGSIAQPIIAPKQALPQFGGLKISLSSTALTGLEDAVKYLVEYPFECTEQTASRAMPIFALRKILPAFKIGKVSDAKKVKSFAYRAITKLLRNQRNDGGWGYWSGSRKSYMWLSSYAMYTLLRAREAGYKISQRKLNRGFRFLRNRLRYSPFKWERKNPTVRIMAVWVASEQKANLGTFINTLYKKKKQLPMFAKSWLMVAIHRHNKTDSRVANLLRILNNSAIHLPGRVHFSERKTEDLRMLMHSEDRSDAIILGALLEVRPKHPLIPKVVRGLMRSRIRGRWSTTQSNAYAMLGLSKYFSIYEKVVPNFTVQSWLGNGFLGKSKMKGRSMTIIDQKIPMSFLKKRAKSSQKLVLFKQGKGRLYYRLGLRYAPKNLKLASAEEGFTVHRTYEAIHKKSDVIRHKDGHWQFKAGTYIRVRLRIVSPSSRYYVAVVDPLPAGLEAVNLGFKTSAQSALQGQQTRSVRNSYSWYSYFAFNHHEKRDSMVVLFANRLPAGVYQYTYVARATTIGNFVIPPMRAEEMYSPEIFGRTATMFSEVVPK